MPLLIHFVISLLLSSANHLSVPSLVNIYVGPQAQSNTSAQGNLETIPVHLRFLNTISSEKAKVGEHVAFEVVDDVSPGGSVIVARGSTVDGRVVKAVHRGHNRRNGELIVAVDRILLVDGSFGALHNAQTRVGNSKTLPVFGPCTFPLPADPVGLFRRGHDVVIDRGTAMTAILDVPHRS